MMIAASDTIERMINGPWKTKSPVQIGDTSKEAFVNFFRIIYDQPVVITSAYNAYELYKLSDQYFVDKAKQLCNEYLPR